MRIFKENPLLWGGVFKGRFADPMIEKIKEETADKKITIVNQSSENAAVIFARMFKGQVD